MGRAFGTFKECNPSAASDLKVVIVDKDFKEIAVIQELFNGVRSSQDFDS